MAVHEDQPRTGQIREGELAQGIDRKTLDVCIEDRLEGELRDGRDVGEAPVFMLEGREAQFGEAGDACLAHRKEPAGLAAGAGLLEALEGPQDRVDLLRRVGGLSLGGGHVAGRLRCQALTGWCLISQSYPFSSSSRASSLPPDFAMRPSQRTCTKSGTM